MYESTIHSKYKGNFEVSLYGEDEKNPLDSLSKWDKAYFTFQFERNNVIADGSTDIYKIKVPNGCMIIRKYTTTSNGGVLNTIANTITYNNSPYSNEVDNTNTVVMQCTVDKLVNTKKQVIASVEVEETIGEKTFTYMDGIYEQTLKDYYEKHPLPIQRAEWKQTETEKYLLLPTKDTATEWSAYLPINKAPLTDSNFLIYGNYAWFKDNNGNTVASLNNLYDIFNVVWLQHILTIGSSYKDEIISYVQDAYPNEASIKEETKKLPGLKVTKYQASNGPMWRYEILENFVGYARTAAVDFTKNNYMYFSTVDENILNEAFKMYLEEYPYQGVDKEELTTIVNTYGVSKILKLADANGDIFIDGKHLFHYDASDNRLELIKEIVEPDNIVRVPFGDEATMKATFASELKRVYSDLSENAIAKITQNDNNDIIKSLLKNSTLNSNKESYSEYFIVQDGTTYLLVNVYSTGIDYTYATVSTLDAKLENNALSISFGGKDQNDLLNIVNALDKYFVGNKLHNKLVDDNYIVVTKVSDNYTKVVYSVPNPSEQATVSYKDDTKVSEMVTMFRQELSKKYSSILSEETLEFIFVENAKAPAAKNPGAWMVYPASASADPGESYNKYFVVPGKGDIDKGKYLLFNVYTGGYDSVYVTISVLASKEENGTISFTLSDNNKVKLNNMIGAIDIYFGTRLDTTTNGNEITVSYSTTSTVQMDSSQVEEVKEISASFKTAKANEKYLEVVSSDNAAKEEKSSVTTEEKENKKYSKAQDTETKNTTEETEETSNDDPYVPSNDASNVDAVPSSDGGTTNTTSSITNEVVGINSPTSGVPLVDAG